jgi:integrase
VAAGVPIEQIQALCGHKTKTTTERYVKQRWREAVQPNTDPANWPSAAAA